MSVPNTFLSLFSSCCFLGSIGWIAGLGQAGSAIIPFTTGALAASSGIWTLHPLYDRHDRSCCYHADAQSKVDWDDWSPPRPLGPRSWKKAYRLGKCSVYRWSEMGCGLFFPYRTLDDVFPFTLPLHVYPAYSRSYHNLLKIPYLGE